MAADGQNLEDFLSKVDEIESIVKGFGSSDQNKVVESFSKADSLISKINKTKDSDEDGLPKTKTGFSKTSINNTKGTEAPGQDVNFDGMDQAGFMKALEVDAAERAKKRQERGKIAAGIKEKGNEEFRQGNFEKAVELYTQAIQEVKDNTALYTNRAQAYIKLGKYKEAIEDCEWALRVFPNCVKAYIHQGRAQLGLKEYEAAREAYKSALNCDPKKESLINDYLSEVDRTELCDKQEHEAEQVFSEGRMEDVGIVDILSRAQKPDQLPVFYSGGFRVLKSLLLNTSDKTLFRTNGGISLVTSHSMLHRCLTASPKSLSKEELDMLTSAFEMFTESCRDNEKNTELLLQTEGFPAWCCRYLEVKMKGQGRLLKCSILNCLYTMSQLEIGQKLIVEIFDIPKLLALVFTLIRTHKLAAQAAASLLNNIALQKKFKAQLRDKVDETVSPAFELLLAEEESVTALPLCISTITNMTSDRGIRSKLAARKPLWEACTNLMTSRSGQLQVPLHKETMNSVLGLLVNLSTESSEYLQEFGASICDKCLALIQSAGVEGDVVLRGVTVISHILPHCIPAVDMVVEKGGTAVLMGFIKDETSDELKPAMKALTALTQVHDEAKTYIVNNKGLGVLMKRLQCEDEVVVGNAALCLSHCTEIPKMCAVLTKTDIIKDLLVLARDGKRPAVQQNCAILIAKLAQGDSKHLDRLRDLHGIEILHSCMKYIKT